ncbi:unnamed protein product, partial [Timema podura]|nr:unnamed protein product [Timema podura]
MLGMAILYALRGNLSIAIVAMVNHTAISQYNLSAEFTSSAKEEPCDWVDEEMQDAEDGELNWDSTYQAFILSGFFYGYLVGQIPGGILTERFHGKLVFGLGLLVTAIFTIVSPFTLWVSGELFFVTRLLEGLAESVTTPALQYMITRWAPLNERNRFSGMFSGNLLQN